MQKNLEIIAEKVRNRTHLRSGTLMAEAYNEKQSHKPLKTFFLGSYPIIVKRHASLNSFLVVYRTDSLNDMSKKEIQQSFSEQYVFKVSAERTRNHSHYRTYFSCLKSPHYSHIFASHMRGYLCELMS
jgi:hypothetical protein